MLVYIYQSFFSSNGQPSRSGHTGICSNPTLNKPTPGRQAANGKRAPAKEIIKSRESVINKVFTFLTKPLCCRQDLRMNPGLIHKSIRCVSVYKEQINAYES